jgi:hypothetical protein
MLQTTTNAGVFRIQFASEPISARFGVNEHWVQQALQRFAAVDDIF